jgi:hypothetical protein
MFQPHPSFPQPADDSKSVWRYMNLSKFVWMLQHRALFFCRSDQLGDPYEGYYPMPIAESEDQFVETMRPMGALAGHDQDANLRQLFKQFLTIPLRARQETFLSCWHMNEAESLAMWKLYTAHSDSICIRSTYRTLAELLPAPCFLGVVKYINYRTDAFPPDNTLNYIVHKRKSFEHEREARAVIWKGQGVQGVDQFEDIDGKGLLVTINIDKLIQEIFVSPDSDSILRGVIERLAETYGIDAPVLQSEVNAPPSY